MYKINELTPEQVKAIADEFPLANPKQFQLVEEDKLHASPMTLEFCDTKEEAEKAITEWEARDELSDDISDFFGDMVEKYSNKLPEKEIRQTIKEY